MLHASTCMPGVLLGVQSGEKKREDLGLIWGYCPQDLSFRASPFFIHACVGILSMKQRRVDGLLNPEGDRETERVHVRTK